MPSGGLGGRRIYFGNSVFSASKTDQLRYWRDAGERLGFVPVRHHESPNEVFLHNLRISDALRVIITPGLRGLPRSAIITEPKVVLPHLAWKLWERIFNTIFWLGRISPTGESFANPYEFPVHLEIPGVEGRVNNVVLVNANKISMSKGELYSLRRQAILAHPDIHVYGSGWNDSALQRVLRVGKESIIALAHPAGWTLGTRALWLTPANYRGVIRDKISVTSRYKVSLVIENSQEGVTEKLFDAWVAGCIPVYVGPNLSSFDIPKTLVVQADASTDSIHDAISLALQMDHGAFLEELGAWIGDSPAARFWAWEPAMRRIFERP